MTGPCCRRRRHRLFLTPYDVLAVLLPVVVLTRMLDFASAGSTACPGDCSGNGLCDATTTHCNCYDSWTGHNCNTRKCPSGPAWVSMPHEAADDVHSTATAHLLECSGVGDCADGKCGCSAPYSGSACERIQCPPGSALPCNGNGRCISLKEAGALKDDVSFFSEIAYNAWDAERIYGCVCDGAFTGYDCSLRKCPYGDDPHSGAGGNDEIQKITCTATSGTFNVQLYGHLTRTLNFNDSPNELKAALEELPAIRGLTVNSYDNSNVAQNTASGVLCASGFYWLVTFTHVPGDIPNLVFPKEAESGLPVYHSTPTAAQTTSQECSGRGACTRTGSSAGMCSCQAGYSSSDGSGTNADGSAGDCAKSASPVCPGFALTGTNCGGHGVCTSNVCSCDSEWTGYDCALRTCPKGHAWFDEPSATDVAHGLVECSGKGICDRGSGKCTCESGFAGTACDRTECPRTNGAGVECNGRGRCMTLRTLGTFRKVNGVAAPLVYGSVPGSSITWDADKVMGCLCDQGRYDRNQYSWIGTDCAFRTCSRGDDLQTDSAKTGFHQAEVQQVTCSATSGTFTLGFRGSTTTAVAFDAQATGTNTTLAPTGTVTFGDSRLVTNSIDIQSLIAAGDFVIVQNSLKTEERIFEVLSNPTGPTTSTSHGIIMTEPIGMTSGSDYVLYKIVTSVESALEALDTIGDVTVSYDEYLTLAALTNTLPAIAGHATGGTTTNVATTTSGSGSGLIATVITGSSNPPTLTSVTVTTAGAGYKVGDIITFAGTGSDSAGKYETFTYVLVAGDFASEAACSATGIAWKVTFHTEHSDVPDLVRTTSSLSGGSSSMNLVNSVVGTTEDEECSLHGACDRTQGLCTCDAGWTSSDGLGKYGTKGDCGALISSSSCQSSFCASTVRL